MENCLVTKLDGVVSNPDLKKIGELDVAFTTSNGFVQINCKANKTVEVELIDTTFASVSLGNTLVDSTHAIIGSTTGSSSGFTVNVPANHTGDYTFHAKIYNGKYNLNYLSYATLDLDGLEYCRPMAYALYIRQDGGSLSSLAGIEFVRLLNTGIHTSNLSAFIGSGTYVINIPDLEGYLSHIAALSGSVSSFSTTGDSITGDLSVFEGALFTSLALTNCINITGDISVIGSMQNIETINLTNAVKLHGTIESIAQTARTHGRTSGSIMLPNIYTAGSGNITWKGVAATGSASSKIEWTATTITYNGETITA